MRKSFGSAPVCYPQPVFILAAYDDMGNANAMNAAWGGISEENEISLCIGAGRKTLKNLQETGAFTVSMGTADQVKQCDYVGIVSGNHVPAKLEQIGWTVTKAETVNAPLIDQLPMALECKYISFDPDTCRLVGQIVNVCADESVLNADGKIDPAKLRPITFDPMNNAYLVLGEKVGNAFRDGLELK